VDEPEATLEASEISWSEIESASIGRAASTFIFDFILGLPGNVM
jgi:hypothetical protein